MKNYGKIFQEDFQKSSLNLPDVSMDRIYDTTSGFKGHSTICDFQAYMYPFQYYFELKSYDGERIPFSAIRPNQYDGLLEKSKIKGVIAGIIFNFRKAEKEQYAWFVDIRTIEKMKLEGKKSIKLDDAILLGEPLVGTRKVIRYNYLVHAFLDALSEIKENELNDGRSEESGTDFGLGD
jgi:penicillin-binding protein-related factor A (putative recombinase)